MKPTDIRDMNWADIQSRLTEERERVYWALSNNGPCTTEVLAMKMEISVLSVRPRVTELCQLGLAEIIGRDHRDGIYKAVALDVARARHEASAAERTGGGEQLLIGATA